MLIDEDQLKLLGLTRDEFIEKESRNFDYQTFYGDIIQEVVDINLGREATAALDTAQLFAAYQSRPLSEHQKIHDKWEDIFLEELTLIAEAMMVAVSRSVAKHTQKNVIINLAITGIQNACVAREA